MKKVAFLLLTLLLSYQGSASTIIYVDSNAPGVNDGTSWEDAYNFLADGLDYARDHNDVNEIRVAEGIYTPDSNSVYPDGTGDREASFNLISGVTLKGGFASCNQPDPNERDFELYQTILSGDLDGNDVDVNDPCDLLDESTRAENSIHVVSTVGTGNSAVLDGFIITGGNANGEYIPRYWGGGIYNENQPDEEYECTEQGPTIMNCKITRNFAAGEGGGMYNRYSCEPRLIDCEFTLNMARWGGGAIKNDTSNPKISRCIFRNNISKSSSEYHPNGGAIDNEESSPLCSNCLFIENEADYGGAVSNWMCNCNPRFVNCIFYGNTAQYGGVLWVSNNFETSHIQFNNCTLTGNSAYKGSAISCTKGFYELLPSYVDVNNCIFWNGGNEINNEDGSIISITYSDIEGGWPSEGNIDVDPLFANPDANDFHLRSQGGRWDADSQSWVTDSNTSPCIDAGDPSAPIMYEPFPNGGRINMGTYGGTVEASKSYFGKPPCEIIVAGDINGDCKVNFKDFAFMAYHWLEDKNP